jgi:hypothetical protein
MGPGFRERMAEEGPPFEEYMGKLKKEKQAENK